MKSNRSWWQLFSWVLIALAVSILFFRSLEHGGYFAEDAYISFRYAENLAGGHGLVWNIGGERIEGYTSALHIFLLALGAKIGLSIQFVAIVISYVAIAGLIGIYWFILRKEKGYLTPIGAMALFIYMADSRLAIHGTAGLDTVMYMFLLAADFAVSVYFVEQPSRYSATALAVINIFSLLGRPDAAPYIVAQGIVISIYAVYLFFKRKETHFLLSVVLTYALLIIIGAIYMAWKLWYFGYLLPNPFYIKSNEYSSFHGLNDVTQFLKTAVKLYGPLTIPPLFFMDYSAVRTWWKMPASKIKTALLIGPTVLYLLYYTTVVHEVGYADRFEYPVYFFITLTIGLFLSLGSPIENLFSRMQKFLSTRIVTAGLVIAILLFIALVYRYTEEYFPWFKIVEEGYYRPIGEALESTGLGPKATIVFDSAGVVPFVSKFTHIDPVGLNDNTLSGREPITIWEREAYIWGRNPDVYIGPYPPATNDATGCNDDPIMQGDYAQKILLAPITGGPYFRAYGHLSYKETCDVSHLRMRELRDDWSFLGEIPFPVPVPPEYTTFVYVRNGSPYADQLVAALSPLIVRQPDELDLGEPIQSSQK